MWRNALVTGANRGLGLEFARHLVAAGTRVTACCRQPSAAAELQALASGNQGRLRIEALDLAEPDAIDALAARLAAERSSLDLLVNNAGVLVSGERFGKVRAAPLAESFAVNASAPLLLTQALAPLLERGHQPHVLCVSTQIASIAQTSSFRTVSYAMSKVALNMAVRRLAAALGPRGVCVIAVHPGWLRTRMGGDTASVEPGTAARLLLELTARLGVDDGGGFYASDGTPIPW
ncbi:MAG TPA: SDR family oxidoreductase [Rhodanobacteraceae bacterium]|nr:SDR family oxidoreductase [Rhodanobacteraceae bacterium]